MSAARAPASGLRPINIRGLLEILVARERHAHEDVDIERLQVDAEVALMRLFERLGPMDAERIRRAVTETDRIDDM